MQYHRPCNKSDPSMTACQPHPSQGCASYHYNTQYCCFSSQLHPYRTLRSRVRARSALARRRYKLGQRSRRGQPQFAEALTMLCRATASSSVPAAAAVFALLCCFGATVVRGQYPYSVQKKVDALVGAICEPPFGFLPLPCGDYEELRRVSVPAPVFLYG